MSNNQANQCPKCKTFILGDYCHICEKNINEPSDKLKNMFKDIDGDSNLFEQLFNDN